MNYIKEYFNFNELWKETTISELRARKSVPILRRNVDSIRDYLISVQGEDIVHDILVYTDSFSFNTEKFGVDISLDNDDWYKVSIIFFSNSGLKNSGKQLYYLCDSMEGLKDLLNKTFIDNI